MQDHCGKTHVSPSASTAPRCRSTGAHDPQRPQEGGLRRPVALPRHPPGALQRQLRPVRRRGRRGTPRDVKACHDAGEARHGDPHPHRHASRTTARCGSSSCSATTTPTASRPACRPARPTSTSRRYLRHVADGNFEAAVRVIKDRNPFPSVCGRVCPHPCEAAVPPQPGRRAGRDQPRQAVRRRLGHGARASPGRRAWPSPPASGSRSSAPGRPALRAAYYAAHRRPRRHGLRAPAEAGGMMRYGIPEYRLPKATLDAEIATITSPRRQDHHAARPWAPTCSLEDLQARLRRRLPGDRLLARHPDADRGRERRRRLARHPLPRARDQGRRHPTRRAPSSSSAAATPPSTAPAQPCARAPSASSCVYRRTRDEMPAEAYEVEEALHEGVEMLLPRCARPRSPRPGRAQAAALHAR